MTSLVLALLLASQPGSAPPILASPAVTRAPILASPAVTRAPISAVPAVMPAAQSTIKVASWNVENLFDRYDDPWRDDQVTRPQYASAGRLARIGAVLRDIDADVVCLQEVENRFLLEDFVRKHLNGMGYTVVLVEGNDGRGIDVAVLSRLPVGPVTSHRHLEFQDDLGRTHRFQRDLLKVRIGAPLNADVYVVHLKSQRGGDPADSLRAAEGRAAAGILKKAMDSEPGYRGLIAGDFNDQPDSPTLQPFFDLGWADACAGSDAVTYNREPYRTRIDFVILSPALAGQLAESLVIETEPVLAAADHNPVIAVLN